MKKLLSLSLALAISLLSFTGCTNNQEASSSLNNQEVSSGVSPEETVTLHFWGGIQPEAGPQQVVDNFNEEFKDKGIQVEYERFVNDEQGNIKLDTSLLAGDDIDVYICYGSDRIQKRVDAQMALDLTDLMARDNFDYVKLFGSSVEDAYTNGKPYSIATTITKGSLLVNKDMFDEAGIEIPTEWTFEEFREVCKKLTKGEGQDKVYGMFWNTQQNISEYWLYFAKQTLGGDLLYKEGGMETNLDNDIIKKSAQLVFDTMQDGSAPTHVDSVTQKLTQETMFLSGRCAMVVGNWIIRNVKDLTQYPHDFVTVYAPYPVVEEGQRNYCYGIPGDNMMINPKSSHIDEAWEFVKWYSTEGMLPMASGGRIPLCSTFSSDDIANEFLAGSKEIIDVQSAIDNIFPSANDKLTTPTITTKMAEITAVLNEEVEAYFTGKSGLDEAFANAKARADEFLQQ